MDDLVQVLLFVLTLIIFIFSALRKQKKKPVANSSPADDLLESIFGIPQPVTLITPFEEPEATEPPKETLIKPLTVSLPEEGIVAIQNNPVAINPIIEELETPIPSIDLRTAIIYSEILTRKNF